MSDAEYELLNKLYWVGCHQSVTFQKLHRHFDMYFSIFLVNIFSKAVTTYKSLVRLSSPPVSYPSVFESIVKYNTFFDLF